MLGFLSFKRLNNIPLYACTHHVFFVRSSVGRHLGYFPVLGVMHNAAMNMEVQLSLRNPSFGFFGCIPRSETAESYAFFSVFEESPVFPIATVPVYISNNSLQGFQ